MKKRIIAVILVLILTLSVFSGCTLIEQDQTKVLSQPVITIGAGENAQEVTISDVISSYNQVAYIYINYYGMTHDQVLSMILDSLVTQNIFTYAALENLQTVGSSDILYERYLTAEEIAEVKAEVDKAIASEIDALEVKTLQGAFTADGTELTKIEDKKTPEFADTSTTVPADFDGTDSREAAISAYKKQLSANGYSYEEMYDLMYNSHLEAAVTSKYKDVIMAEYSVSIADLQKKYTSQLADEMEYFAAYGEEEYMKKFDTDYSDIIYNPTGEEFGYVKQILVAFTDEQKAELEDLEGDALEAKRLELAKKAVAFDLRESYLLKYGYNTENDGLFSRYDFNGTVSPVAVDGVQTRDEEGNFAYSAITANEYKGYDSFLSSVVNSYLGGKVAGNENGFDVYTSNFDNEKFDNLMFAFNADTALNGKDFGYFVENKDFVPEFNAAAKTLFDYGVGSYTIGVSDFGYHIIYLTKTVSAAEKTPFVESEMKTEGTFSYNFANLYTEIAKSAYFDEKVTAITDEYDTEENVVWNEKTYETMIAMFNAS